MRRYRIRGGLILRIAVLAWCGFALWTMIVSVTTYFVLTTAWTLYLALEPMFDVRDLVPVPCYVVSISLAWAVHLRVRRGWVVGPLALALTVAAFFAGVYLYTFEIVGTVDNDAVLWARYLWPALTRALIYVFLQVAV